MKNHWSDKKVLVTGGTGFIGKSLVRRLESYGAKILSIGSKACNLENAGSVNWFFDDDKYDYIFHLATWTRPGAFCLHHSAEQYRKNTLMHVNVLDAWHRFQPQAKLIGIGSSCSYPGNLTELRESDYWNGEPHESLLAYAMTKRCLYSGQVAYKKQYGMRSLHPIFPTVYGPNDHFDEERSHCASALIRRFCLATARDEPFVIVWGDGTQEREFVHINDEIDGLLLAAERHEDGLINLGAGRKTSIAALASTIAHAAMFRGDILYDPSKFAGIQTKVLNSDLAKKAIGWEPKIGLEEGIADTVKWYIENRLEEDLVKE